MDFDAVYSDPQTVHPSSSWSSLRSVEPSLLPAISAWSHFASPTRIQTEFLSADLSESFLTVITGHQNCGKTVAICLFAISVAMRRPELKPAVLVLTPDDSRARHVLGVMHAFHPSLRLANMLPSTTRPDCSILILSLSRPQFNSRFSSSKDFILSQIDLFLLDDADECLSSKEWRNTIGAMILGHAIDVRQTKKINSVFAHREWKEWSRKFTSELVGNIKGKWANAPEIREFQCAVGEFQGRVRGFALVGAAPDLIPLLFLQDQITLSSPLLFIARNEAAADLIRSRLASIELKSDIINSALQTSQNDDKFANFLQGQSRFLIIFPDFPRKFQTVRPATVVLVGVNPREESTLEEIGCVRKYKREGTVVVVTMREDEAEWVSARVGLRLERIAV